MLAGRFRATDWKINPVLAGFTSYKYNSVDLFRFPIQPSSKLGFICNSSFAVSPVMMAQNSSPEVKEPTPKIQKLDQNGVHGGSEAYFKVKKLSDKAVVPKRASPLSAGYDLSSAMETKVPARGKALVPTDLSIAVPEGTYARIAPRSGLAWKHSIDVGAGVIDADYRGPVGVILFNHSDVDFEVKSGDRIAQLIIEKIVTPEVMEVEDLDSTVRGEGGFGSTGV
ncbi:PREDICTED: deoxyuridine 5'-triphosphate nucleotidohydrolase [Tarenaya hassleriana]|uniref:deoxyuridine 5'-triphosphate nucleotidohydrolase n=1 Tax=Tarenaya hassleriana TaxID=28532 RepID=UPI00053C3425|nr:PREDICTED: deoxyuridine 5'-triphosphate nucleotidohydrolase [Tarenaya hassleriana]